MTKHPAASAPVIHAALQPSTIVVDVYNAELRSPDGFAGDLHEKRALDAILDDWREKLRKGRQRSPKR
jgi:hypothetical protein